MALATEYSYAVKKCPQTFSAIALCLSPLSILPG